MSDRGRRLQPRGRGHRGGLRHQRAVRDSAAGPGGAVQGLPGSCAHGQRAGVHQPSFHRLGAGPRHPAHPDRAGATDAERLHRELQRSVSGRVLERAMGRGAAPSPQGDRCLAARQQRSAASRHLTPASNEIQSPSTRTAYESLVRRMGAGQAGRPSAAKCSIHSRAGSAATSAAASSSWNAPTEQAPRPRAPASR